jgi:zinc transport system ATP-binding protein
MDTILDVKNLHIVIGTTSILEDVSFSVEKGEVAAIIGPNGAGKTMLFKALLGLVPYSGYVKWESDARIGYVPQRIVFDPQFPITVREFFLLKLESSFWRPKKETDEKIIKALEEVGLSSRIDSRVGALSFGEFQRVLIAYALINDPNVLLFDEPTSGIDIGAEESIYEILHKIASSRDLTLLIISHDLNVVYEFADKVICLNHEMLCYGPPRKVLTPQALEELYRGAAFYVHNHRASEK